MNEITLITPPDVLNNDAYSILVICPTDDKKQSINNILSTANIHLNLYFYENEFDNVEWLINLIKKVDIAIIDVDNCNTSVQTFLSHFIAQPNTFYLTNNSIMLYNLISKNRIYNLTWLEDILNRGKDEENL